MTGQTVTVGENSITVSQLEIKVPEVVDFFRTLPDPERVPALVKAVEVGVFCIERGRTAQDADFIKRKIGELIAQVEEAVVEIPTRAEEKLLQSLSTDDGQVLSPIKALIENISSEMTKKIDDLRRVLSDDLDPSNSRSVLGHALRSFQELLNPKNTDSIQHVLGQAVDRTTADNGTLAKAVKSQVDEALKPLVAEVDRLAKEIRGREAAAEAIQQTTLKGGPYEDEVATILQRWGQVVGAEVMHVGVDNQPGDIVVNLRPNGMVAEPLSIVIEVRDRSSRAMGRQAIASEMTLKIAERNADCGIYLSRSQSGLSSREIGDWGEGSCNYGTWIACTHEHLLTAVRFLVVQQRLAALRAATPQVDSACVEQQLKAIRTALGRIRTIKTKVTDLGGCADVIDQQANSLRDEIKEALSSIEDSLRDGQGRIHVAESTSAQVQSAG
jgi:hypothetical protein